MARIIPATINTRRAPPGEQLLFQMFEQERAQTADWIVIHSLDLAEHSTKVSGEIDFIVIIPGTGTLVLEVKSHEFIQRKEGLWLYGRNLEVGQNPFRQAEDAMHSLLADIKSRRPAVGRVPFWFGVIFPFCRFEAESPEWFPWQLIDQTRLGQESLHQQLRRMMVRARQHLAEKKSWLPSNSSSPSVEECNALLQTLRGDFEFFLSPRARRQRLKIELLRYTEEQFTCLDSMDENLRIMFLGPAGTGKTILAIESVRRAEQLQRKVLFCCYNALLAKKLREEVSSLCSSVTCGTLHQVMIKVAGVRSMPGVTNQAFWREELPEQALAAALELDDAQRFDELVLDETQDLLVKPYLDFLDAILKGGLRGGRWKFFGDFEKQRIYSGQHTYFKPMIESYGSPVYCSLRINCRNTPRIAFFTSVLGGLNPDYKRVLRPDDCIDPVPDYYSSIPDEVEILLRRLTSLYEEGFTADDIVLLSTKATSPCALNITAHPWVSRLASLEGKTSGQIGYCTVHAFKGLESPVVIVTDIESVSTEFDSDLLYVAASRAVSRLYLLAHETVKADIEYLFTNRLRGKG